MNYFSIYPISAINEYLTEISNYRKIKDKLIQNKEKEYHSFCRLRLLVEKFGY